MGLWEPAWQALSLAAFAVTGMALCILEMASVRRGSEFLGRCWIGACFSRVRPGKWPSHFLFSPSEEVGHTLWLAPKEESLGPWDHSSLPPPPGVATAGILRERLQLVVGSQTLWLLAASVHWDSEQIPGADPCLQWRELCGVSACARPGLTEAQRGRWPHGLNCLTCEMGIMTSALPPSLL